MSDDKKVGYVAQFAGTLSTDGLSISINFNMPEDATKEQFGEKIDLLREVVLRQRAKGEVSMLEAMIAEKEAMVRNQKLDLRQYLKKPGHSIEDDPAQRIQARIEEMEADIERGKVQLEETRARAV